MGHASSFKGSQPHNIQTYRLVLESLQIKRVGQASKRIKLAASTTLIQASDALFRVGHCETNFTMAYT